MKRIVFSLFIFLISPALLWAQSSSDKTVVGKVGKEKVTYAELKNNINSGEASNPTLQELEEFLPVYLDYKAKLKAAQDLGYYQDSSLIEEHKAYAKQAAYAKWLQSEIKPTLFESYYERSTEELKTFHILIAADARISAEREAEIKQQLQEAKEKIQEGVPLEEVNQEYSTKRNGRSMGGDIPWISAGRTVSEFEDVAYNLEVGEISEPFKTQFGYHIVLLQDRRERTRARQTSHIYVRATQDTTAYQKISKAYAALEDGQPWGEVVQDYTEDGNSRNSGGRLGWVSYQSNFAMNFVDAVMNISPESEYSEPVQTNYGYHIFKIDSVQTYASEEERRAALMKGFEDSPAFEENNAFVVSYLKDRFETKTFENNLEQYSEWLVDSDSLMLSEIDSPGKSLLQKPVYHFKDTKKTIGDLHQYFKEKYANRMGRDYADDWFNNFVNYVIDENIIELTKEVFPEFKKQSKSYMDGLVVYQINDDKVWSSATVDTSRLEKIYEDNPEEYSYSERPYYYLITSAEDSLLMEAKAFIQEGNNPDSLKTEIKGIAFRADSLNSYTESPYNRLENLDEGEFSEPFEYNKRRAIFWLKDRLPSRRMTFEEAFSKLLADFQPVREQEWLNKIRDEYNVKVYTDKLSKAYQKDS
ncbi:peptidylprolyl isomerase [Gracilimonas mengyeensis]|nr:peptidylprolyl isomerase [Gracilimonas mengyeensis]